MSGPFVLAFEFSPSVWAVVGIVGLAILGVAWFAVKFWLASTRPADIKEVQTPTLDRLNQRALAALGEDDEDEDEAPEGLRQAVDEPVTPDHPVSK